MLASESVCKFIVLREAHPAMCAELRNYFAVTNYVLLRQHDASYRMLIARVDRDPCFSGFTAVLRL